jgi:hypothetical protein
MPLGPGHGTTQGTHRGDFREPSVFHLVTVTAKTLTHLEPGNILDTCPLYRPARQ